MRPIISIIIPVYNVEKYIDRCVNSVMNQSFQNFEIILVDDGSTDNSGIICDKYQDDRIKVIHKKNGGPSDARNVGIGASTGNYITWIDSDDFIHKDYLKKMYKLIRYFCADMVVCEFVFCEEKQKDILKKSQYKNAVFDELKVFRKSKQSYEIGVVSGMEGLKRLLRGEMHSTSVCGLMLKRRIAKEIPFPVGKYHEDDLTIYKYFISSNTVAYTKQPMYAYYQHIGSIMHRPFSQIDIDQLDAGDRIFDDCKQFGIEYIEAALAKKANNYFQILIKFENLKETQPETYNRILSFIKDNKLDLVINPYIEKKEKIKVILQIFGLMNIVKKVLKK